MASVLEIAQKITADRRVPLAVPSVLFGGSTQDAVVLRNVINEMARRIARAHNWEMLKKIATVTGDGTATAFARPTDYDRMDKKAQLWSSTFSRPFTKVDSLDKWVELDALAYDTVVNRWIMYGGEIHIKEALASGVTAQYPYISNTPVLDGNGTTQKAAFDSDEDTWRLDDELLELGTIWQYRETKGLPYAEDMATYERAKAKRIMEDKGARTIKVGKPRIPPGVTIASPYSIDPNA